MQRRDKGHQQEVIQFFLFWLFLLFFFLFKQRWPWGISLLRQLLLISSLITIKSLLCRRWQVWKEETFFCFFFCLFYGASTRQRFDSQKGPCWYFTAENIPVRLYLPLDVSVATTPVQITALISISFLRKKEEKWLAYARTWRRKNSPGLSMFFTCHYRCFHIDVFKQHAPTEPLIRSRIGGNDRHYSNKSSSPQ